MTKLCSVLYTATVPSSKLEQFQIFGTSCLDITTKTDFPHLCSLPIIIFSANGLSEVYSLLDQTNFFNLEFTAGKIFVCFGGADPFYQKFGDVKEVLVQEVCSVRPDALCTNLSINGNVHEANIYGNRGIITLNPNGTGLPNIGLLMHFSDNACKRHMVCYISAFHSKLF